MHACEPYTNVTVEINVFFCFVFFDFFFSFSKNIIERIRIVKCTNKKKLHNCLFFDHLENTT